MTEPFETFAQWYEEAQALSELKEPTAMSLATCTADGKPSCRIILLKHYDERGFVFYTNHNGRKSQEIYENPNAALCFYWMPIGKQIRIEGAVEKVSDEEADAYFASRRRGSQIGAWASHQSEPLASREELEQRIADVEAKYEAQDVPRPPHWHGWRLAPNRIEFWNEGDFRIHDLWVYTKNDSGGWGKTLLNP